MNYTEVNIKELYDFQAFLVRLQQELDPLFDDLNTAMGSINSAWSDEEGKLLISKFFSFITESKKINIEISALAAFLNKIVVAYDTIKTDALRMMVE